MTDARPTHPNFYLERAQTCTRTIRSWVHRNNPPPLDPEPDSVVWVMGIFDDLERQLAGAVKSADVLLPDTAGNVAARVRENTRQTLNLHQLQRADESTRDIINWVSSARWSTGVTPEDLEKLQEHARQIKANLRHLIAQAEEQDLAR